MSDTRPVVDPLATSPSVTEQLAVIEKLADRLLAKVADGQTTRVVPFVGAGASMPAGLPSSATLQRQIYARLIKADDSAGIMARLLDEEARYHYPAKARRGILYLSLFEFAEIVSRLAYAREVLHEVVSSVLSQATHRPLAYELLAHLAKHGYVDHFVSLNFDEFLDDALKDEIPERLRRVTTRDEIPGSRSNARTDLCYLFKPFGSLSQDVFKLEPHETRQFGSDSIWRFMLDRVFRAKGDHLPRIVVVMIGYAAGEPAFQQLVSELVEEREREVSFYWIDVRPTLPPSLAELGQERRPNVQIEHVRLQADLALDLLLKIMRAKSLHAAKVTGGDACEVWIPTARHEILSSLPHRYVTDEPKRFWIEVVLQAVKSRGFVTVDAVSEISRIRSHARTAHRSIEGMRREGILTGDVRRSRNTSHFIQDYRLAGIDRILEKLGEKLPEGWRKDRREWIVDVEPGSDGAPTCVATSKQVSWLEFMKTRCDEIERAPDVEIALDSSPSTDWLFSEPTPLRTISELYRKTSEMFQTAFRETVGEICLRGVWTTGAWLFHSDEGWAREIGTTLTGLLGDRQLDMAVVLSQLPDYGADTAREKAGKAVLNVLGGFGATAKCRVMTIPWWQLNRVFTVLTWPRRDGTKAMQGIFMRRRLSTPLVAPVHVRGVEDCSVLLSVFEHYVSKAQQNARTVGAATGRAVRTRPRSGTRRRRSAPAARSPRP